MGCLTSNKPFDFGADSDHVPNPGVINGIFTTGVRPVIIFTISAALAEVCALRSAIRIVCMNSVYCTVDVNECLNEATVKCSADATCINTNGSYACECPVGYMLLADQRTCDGMHGLFLLSFTVTVRH